ESRFIIRQYLRYGKKAKWSDNDIRSFCNELFEEQFIQNYWNLDKERLIASLTEIKDKLTYQLAAKLVFMQFDLTKTDIRVFMDKNPLYCFFVPDLVKIFPDAKFIHIVRDYRANIASHKKISWILKLDTADMAYRWMRVNQLIEEAKSKVPQKWFTLKYELLVTDTEKVMKNICSFLNIPFDKEMIEGHDKKVFPKFKEFTDDKGFMRFHEALFKSIDKAMINKWKKELTAEDIAIAETIAGNYAGKLYGYERSSELKAYNISPLRMLKIKWTYYFVIKYFGILKYKRLLRIHQNAIIPIMEVLRGKDKKDTEK
ncbi:MAG TPA: sulfotransferase, partial [Bacteroidia bacterium]|nr:sulfotransferase [Bacteroidia bacterium]